ncbi:hypothetical protein C5D35_03630 [Rathayibacter toxicus]|nr:hypothetical protein C5D35_03630 [Rathayibacter toxicus]
MNSSADKGSDFWLLCGAFGDFECIEKGGDVFEARKGCGFLSGTSGNAEITPGHIETSVADFSGRCRADEAESAPKITGGDSQAAA